MAPGKIKTGSPIPKRNTISRAITVFTCPGSRAESKAKTPVVLLGALLFAKGLDDRLESLNPALGLEIANARFRARDPLV